MPRLIHPKMRRQILISLPTFFLTSKALAFLGQNSRSSALDSSKQFALELQSFQFEKYSDFLNEVRSKPDVASFDSLICEFLKSGKMTSYNREVKATSVHFVLNFSSAEHRSEFQKHLNQFGIASAIKA